MNDGPTFPSFPRRQSSSASSTNEFGESSDSPTGLIQRVGALFYGNGNGNSSGSGSGSSAASETSNNSAGGCQFSDAGSTVSSATRSSLSSNASGSTNLERQMGCSQSFGSSSSSTGSVTSFTGGHLTTAAGNVNEGTPYTPVMIHNHGNGSIYISPHAVNNGLGGNVPVLEFCPSGSRAHDEAVRQTALARDEYYQLLAEKNQQPTQQGAQQGWSRR
ncbi:hypothetical protein PG989_016596 [Apiospora arundinis]